jgi:hypothetical protein
MRSVVRCAAAMLLAPVLATAAATPVEQRIQQVESGLLPGVAFKEN